MTMPTGLIFCLRSKINQEYPELSFSPKGQWLSSENNQDLYAVFGKELASELIKSIDLEVDAETMCLDKSSVLAKTYMSNVCLESDDFDYENLATEIIDNINKDIFKEIKRNAKMGYQLGKIKGFLDLKNHSSKEDKIKQLIDVIEQESEIVKKETCRGKGNILITTSNIVNILALTENFKFHEFYMAGKGIKYSGNLEDIKVFVDPYTETDYFVVGYKGKLDFDAGLFHCPYILPFIVSSKTEENKNVSTIKTCYGLSVNSLTSLGDNSNVYYRKVEVNSL